MTSLPDRPDLRQLRIRAKELSRAFEAGDQEAIARVLASHPKFAGRPAERLEGWRLTLRDAQATIARELGFDSWRALSAKISGAPRWDAWASTDISKRAFAEAQDLRHRTCIDLHFLLALLRPPAPTPAVAVLSELGLTYAGVRQRVMEMMPAERETTGTSSSPSFQLILGWAQGIAIGMSAARVTDEHVLMAIVFGSHGGNSKLDPLGVDPDEVVERLRAHGVETPRIEPPIARTPSGPHGPWVYFPKEDWSAVTQELVKAHPPGTEGWSTNASKWKEGYWSVVGEDSIPMEAIVRRAVRDPSSVEVLSFALGMAREGTASSTA